jgi:hypothetical protein
VGDELSREHVMTGVGRSLVEVIARLLERDDREVVLGDLVETRATAWQGLTEILGLVVRRETAFWTHWRPWLAAFAVALPSTLLLMGVSLSISCTYQRLTGPRVFGACSPTGQEDFPLLLCHVLLLIIWSWTVGFVVGSVSRRTFWASAALSLLACVFCLARFREASVSSLSLFLFLPPAILGLQRGLRIISIRPRTAVVVATIVTVLMSCAWLSRALWSFNWALLCPAWYIVVLASRPGRLFERDPA